MTDCSISACTQSGEIIIGGNVSFKFPFPFGTLHFDGLKLDIEVVFLYFHTVTQSLVDGQLHVDDEGFELHIRFQVDLFFEVKADK